MVEKISNIKLKIEELSTLLGFFKQKSIKQVLYKDIGDAENIYQNIKSNLENLQSEYKNFQSDSKIKIDDLTTIYENLKNTFFNLENEYKSLNNEYLEYKNEISEFEKIHKDLLLKNSLVTQLLASKSSENKLDKFKEYLYKDFYDFANTEETLANEAEAFMKLQAINLFISLCIT